MLSRSLLPHLFVTSFGVIGTLLACPAQAAAPRLAEEVTLTAADERLLDEIEHAGFLFFSEQAHPVTKLVRDRARADGSPSTGKASVAASGFGFGAWVIATERGWVTRQAAVEHLRASLQFLAMKAPRQHGFFYHFMESDTGARAWKCELSSIDSALLYAGAIVAREYFADAEITRLVNGLLADVDWNWFRNEGNLVALSWHDETGFSRYRWNKYSEHVLMSFLTLGVSPRPLEASYWQSWSRDSAGRYHDYVYLQEPPLFVNQFPQAFLDLRERRDAYLDFFQNTRLATLAQRQFSLDLRKEFPAWSENLWGLTASDSATGYKAWGGPPRTLRYNALDGTVVPCAAAGSLPFAPQETLRVLHHLKTIYGDRLWKRYGFVDAFNPHTGWVNPDVIGIDVGISVLQAENIRTGLLWKLFMQAPETKLAMSKAGFLSTSRRLDPDQAAAALARAREAWASLQTAPAGAGLQLTALVAAQQLGLISANALQEAARKQLAAPSPTAANEAAQYAAGLITLRQALPALQGEIAQRLQGLDLKAPADPALGQQSRLASFLRIALGSQPAASWNQLKRATERLGPVTVLSPASATDALLPGLWLDERAIVTGASASQLAYASLTGTKVTADPMLGVLQLDQFPREAGSLANSAPTTPDATAALLITTANLLVPDCIRAAFQRDPLVKEARASIPELGEAAFGTNTSIFTQRELAVTPPPPPQRSATVVANSLPRDQWNWQTVAGPEYKDSEADIRPGDAPLAFRFALTWDETALHFHAEVTDAPAGYSVPEGRNRIVELFIDPQGDGLIWTGPQDYQFTYRVGVGTQELFNHAVSEGVITPTEHGYTIEGKIPWRSLGLTPQPGLELGLSAAAITEGTKEWEAMLKLNWSYFPLRAGVYRLGRIRLE